jgi:hypothetical protein
VRSLEQLEANVIHQPNSVELKQALAERYFEQGRWEEAARAYQGLSSLHTSTAALFINRIRLGAAALMIASVLMFITELIKPDLIIGNPGSIRSLSAFASAISSSSYFVSQILSIPALALYSCSAISLYKLLSYTRDHRPAFWAMVLSVIGVGLSMPALGIKSFVFPMLGEMFLDGQVDVLAMYFSLTNFPFNLYLGMGGYLLIAGLAIFGWVISRNRGLSLPAVLLFLAGWIGLNVFGDDLPRAASVAFGVLIALGGLGLGLSLWNQASTQFEAGMDRSSS